MSKTYFGRCAAVGIAGLTAMSSIAIVASAATQASIVYELKYNGVGKIPMKNTVPYILGTTEYCRPINAINVDGIISKGYNVNLSVMTGADISYSKIKQDTTDNTKTVPDTAGTDKAWVYSDFNNGSTSMVTAGQAWTYKAIPANLGAAAAVTLDEVYADRDKTDADPSDDTPVIAFKTAAERTSAKNTMISEIKKEYTTLANAAAKAFRDDINKAAEVARARILKEKNDTIDGAKSTLGTSTDAADLAAYRVKEYNANSMYNAKLAEINKAASKIINEFTQTFNANNFNFDDGVAFINNDAPIVFQANIGGVGQVAGAVYDSFGDSSTQITLEDSRYWSGSTYRDISDPKAKTYKFAGEIVGYTTLSTKYPHIIGGGNGIWTNYSVIKNTVDNGGNTTPSGGSTGTTTTTPDTTTTTTATTWYPDSASYRSASEVSYLGKNGSWYTSSGAASIYGGGYTGTSKNSNYSSVNNSANGKAIYFDSTSGSYTTTSTSYSYIVKEGTTNNSGSNTDPYYLHFFGNTGNNNNTTANVPAGSPAIKGASKYAGWANVSGYITNRARSGASYTINMNDETVVPAAVIAAAKAKNVTLTFANDNGSKVTVKPGKVSTTSDLSVATKYNVKDVKSSLVKKAKKVNPGTVSTAQVRISDDGSLGGTVTVNVKFSTKRSGCTVKAYRLTESGSLRKEATGTIASTGRVNLNLTKGGSYLLVVID